jgi:hypothetical protein
MSPHLSLSSSEVNCDATNSAIDPEDDCDATNSAINPEDGYTLTAFGDLSPSPEEMFCFAPDDIRRRNRLRLKTRRKSAQYSPQVRMSRVCMVSCTPIDGYTTDSCWEILGPMDVFINFYTSDTYRLFQWI